MNPIEIVRAFVDWRILLLAGVSAALLTVAIALGDKRWR
jgi:hypothetical protein